MMRDIITHRGPDDGGLYADEQAALGHRRLSIVDLAAGHQPLAERDESIWTAFNGEIYNTPRCGRSGAGRAHFRTPSDTETMVHVRDGGAMVRRPAARHVRVRNLGCSSPATVFSARPGWA